MRGVSLQYFFLIFDIVWKNILDWKIYFQFNFVFLNQFMSVWSWESSLLKF
jgi:hypothetical protein